MIELVKKYKLLVMIVGIIVLGSSKMYLERQSEQRLELNKESDTMIDLPVIASTPLSEEVTKQSDTKEDLMLQPVIYEEPKEVPIYICGEVVNPGVYFVKTDAIVNDVLLMSGGFTNDAVTDYVNLASKVVEHQKIYIPNKLEEIDKSMDSYDNKIDAVESNLEIVSIGQEVQQQTLININTATGQELETLPGIGPSKASAIITYRTTVKPFKNIEDITNVSGIGEKTLEKIRQLITV